ncbi:MAG TPA: hypothetical protein VLS90_17540, partial [Thermodesulfobacteriota bacterium]|nr:hypothetical protein [Thermodesulfobacteriota bacterium]
MTELVGMKKLLPFVVCVSLTCGGNALGAPNTGLSLPSCQAPGNPGPQASPNLPGTAESGEGRAVAGLDMDQILKEMKQIETGIHYRETS